MDLLAGYKSDSDQSSSPQEEANGNLNGKVILAPPSPPAKAAVTPEEERPAGRGLLSSLPPPSTSDPTPAGPVLSKLPAPGVPSGSKRKPVQFRVPLNFSMPPDSDSEDEAPNKKIKAGPGVKLKDFLPAPKHAVLGAGSGRRLGGMEEGLGGAAVPMAPVRPSAAVENAEDAYHIDNEAYRISDSAPPYGDPEASTVPSGFFDTGQAYVASDPYPPASGPYPPAADPYPPVADPYAPAVGPYPPNPPPMRGPDMGPGPAYSTAPPGGPRVGPAPATAARVGGSAAASMLSDGDRMLQEALVAEAEKAKRRTAKDPFADLGMKLVEVKQEKLTYVNPSKRETMKGARVALGAGYEAKLREEAGPAPDKTARRKHQISSLYHQAKMKELEMMEQRGQSLKTKSETQAKYGWS